MIKTLCMFCKKEYEIDSSDDYYIKLKHNDVKYYVCKKCSFFLQRDAIKISGIRPDDLEPRIAKIVK